jgi:hypothetical protein
LVAPYRTAGAALEQAGQQPGGGGLPDDAVDRAALAADFGAAVAQVEVFDVDVEDFGGAGGSLIQHPPQGLLGLPVVPGKFQRICLTCADEDLGVFGSGARSAQGQ